MQFDRNPGNRVPVNYNQPPLICTERWRGIKFLGEGSFGWVQLAEDLQASAAARSNNSHLKAIKTIPVGTNIKPQEVINHSELQHGNIVRFLDVFISGMFLCIVMEYAPYGNLWELLLTPPGPGSNTQRPQPSSWRLYPFMEDCARWIMQQIVLALQYMHAKQMYNRDLKPHNVLIHNLVRQVVSEGCVLNNAPVIKLCDFGYSKSEQYASAPVSKVGTPSFMAPEVLATRVGVAYSGEKVDAWGCGVMMFVLLSGEMPFTLPNEGSADCTSVILQRIVRCQFVVPVDAVFRHVSNDARDLMSRLLVRDPASRLNLSQIVSHPWLLRNMPANVMPWQQRRLAEARSTGADPTTQLRRSVIQQMCECAMYGAPVPPPSASAAAPSSDGYSQGFS